MANNKNASAFPIAVHGKGLNGQDDYITDGMTKLEYFSLMILQGILSNPVSSKIDSMDCVIESVRLANALLEQLPA